MNRSPFLVTIVAVAALVAACSGSSGGLGNVPTSVPTASASAEPTGPDITPEPVESPSADPSAAPSGAPSAVPSTVAPSAAPSSSTGSGGSPTKKPASPAPATPTPRPSAAKTMTVRAYFVLGGEPGTAGLVPVLRVVPETAGVATAAMNQLLAGPTSAEAGDRTITTALPGRTSLRGLTIKDGVATVDLSTEFDSGGGTASMQYRLAQVVYTLTQFPTVKSVLFQVEGKTVTVFGSEGIVLDGPQARVDYEDQLPSIFVDRPAYGATLGNPGRVTGNANVFEAAFLVAVLDASGKTIADEQVMATCGTGCRGTFDVTIRYTVSKAQWGTLRAYNLSAKDGSVEDARDYPVWLTPAS
jgi:spore germination protein GerM